RSNPSALNWSQSKTSLDESWYESGLTSSALIKLTTALFAPIASARVAIAMTQNPGVFRSPRSATLISFVILVIRSEARPWDRQSTHDARAGNMRAMRLTRAEGKSRQMSPDRSRLRRKANSRAIAKGPRRQLNRSLHLTTLVLRPDRGRVATRAPPVRIVRRAIRSQPCVAKPNTPSRRRARAQRAEDQTQPARSSKSRRNVRSPERRSDFRSWS